MSFKIDKASIEVKLAGDTMTKEKDALLRSLFDKLVREYCSLFNCEPVDTMAVFHITHKEGRQYTQITDAEASATLRTGLVTSIVYLLPQITGTYPLLMDASERKGRPFSTDESVQYITVEDLIDKVTTAYTDMAIPTSNVAH